MKELAGRVGGSVSQNPFIGSRGVVSSSETSLAATETAPFSALPRPGRGDVTIAATPASGPKLESRLLCCPARSLRRLLKRMNMSPHSQQRSASLAWKTVQFKGPQQLLALRTQTRSLLISMGGMQLTIQRHASAFRG
jgi:hypothetical protein